MKIVMGKPKELGEKSASSILSTMNFTQSHTGLNSKHCIRLFEVNGMDTSLSFCCHHHHHRCCIFYPLLCVKG